MQLQQVLPNKQAFEQHIRCIQDNDDAEEHYVVTESQSRKRSASHRVVDDDEDHDDKAPTASTRNDAAVEGESLFCVVRRRRVSARSRARSLCSTGAIRCVTPTWREVSYCARTYSGALARRQNGPRSWASS